MCGSRTLAALTENRESRRLLDVAWDGGAVNYCLERGQWNFATRTVQLDYDPDIEPDFGYRYAFDKPDDYIRTAAFCSDELFQCPIILYDDNSEFWFCDYQTIYVKYISDDEEYGLNFAVWPETFKRFVEVYLASRVAPFLTQSDTKRVEIKKELEDFLKVAKSNDAMNLPPKFLPAGTWSRARHGRSNNRNSSPNFDISGAQ